MLGNIVGINWLVFFEQHCPIPRCNQQTTIGADDVKQPQEFVLKLQNIFFAGLITCGVSIIELVVTRFYLDLGVCSFLIGRTGTGFPS